MLGTVADHPETEGDGTGHPSAIRRLPPPQVGEDVLRRLGVGKRGRPHLHRSGARQEELLGVPTVGDATDSDDRQLRVNGVDIVDGPDRNRMDGPT
jgi:hypothetical protein